AMVAFSCGSVPGGIGTVTVCFVEPGGNVTSTSEAGVKSRPGVTKAPVTAVNRTVEVMPATGPVRAMVTCAAPDAGVLRTGAVKLTPVWASLMLTVAVDGAPSVAPELGFWSASTIVSGPAAARAR